MNPGDHGFREKLREVGAQLGFLAGEFRKLEEAYEAAYESELGFFSPQRWGPSPESGFLPQEPLMSYATTRASSKEDPLSNPQTMECCKTETGSILEATPSIMFLNALVLGSVDDVDELLREGADPNELFSSFSCGGKEFTSGSPLAIAALRNSRPLVRMLIAYSADPDLSEYSFVAGAEQSVWSGSAIHATLPRGSFDTMRLLLDSKADINVQGSNGANLVWQAAYFNQLRILQHCLDHHVDMDLVAVSQDDHTVHYTPLHVAAKTGNAGIVEALLAARASIDTDDGRGHSPLDDAVAQGHAVVTRHLVAANADVFRNLPYVSVEEEVEASMVSWHKSKICTPATRCLDLVFSSGNPLLLSAVAQGLCHSRGLLDYLSTQDFIRFLRGGGDTPVHILNAIFQPVVVRYWQDDRGRRYRRTKTAAFLDTPKGVNIEEGPHSRVLEHCFNCKRQLPGYVLRFLESLLPSADVPRRKMMFVPVTCYMSHIPYLHKDLEVLRAIADCETSEVFDNKGCQAIIRLKWGADAVLARFRVLMAFLEVLNLVFINITLNYSSVEYSEKRLVLWVANVVAAVVWGVAVFFEASQVVGYFSKGLARRYLASGRYWFDFVVLGMTCAVIISTMMLGLNAADSPLYCTLLGALVFLKWMRFLIYLRQIQVVGLRILPITSTMLDVGPFCLVLCVYLIGSVNMYYALGIKSFSDSAIIVYRLVVLGDLNLDEFEGVFPSQMSVMADGSVLQEVSDRTKYYWAVRLLVVVVSFIVGVLMMNLFVAMLCLSYSQAAQGARLSFMRSRANIVLDQHAIRVGIQKLLLPCVCKRRLHHADSFLTDVTNSDSLADDVEEAKSAYIWFACQGEVEE